MTKLQMAVSQGADAPHLLEPMGWTLQQIEAAVRRGELRWLADGRVAVNE